MVTHLIGVWAGFVGGWLLVAGPVHQASLELGQERFDRAGLAATQREVGRPPRLSAWWWLLPPVAYAVHEHRHDAYRAAVTAALPRAQREQFLVLKDRAAGWLLVAGGAVLIAVKETEDLTATLSLAPGALAAIAVVAFAASRLHTVLRERRRARTVPEADTADGPAAPPPGD